MSIKSWIGLLVLSVMAVLVVACGPSSSGGGDSDASSEASNGVPQTSGGSGLAAESVALGYVPSSMAGQHMGQEVTVRGLVKDYQRISSGTHRTLLLFDQSARVERGSSISDQEIPETFTVVVTRDDAKKWPSAASFGAMFDEKVVCATGTVIDYEGSPAIQATEPSQLEADC